jgi:hypothetical protein
MEIAYVSILRTQKNSCQNMIIRDMSEKVKT